MCAKILPLDSELNHSTVKVTQETTTFEGTISSSWRDLSW